MSKLSYLGERSEPRDNARANGEAARGSRLLSGAPRASTFHDIPQMESLLAGYDTTDKINLLIHAPTSNMALKMSSVVKQLLYVSKLFQVTAGCIHIRSKETLRIMYPKYPVLDMIQRIHSRFRIKNLDLNLNKETHPTIERLTLIT